MQVLIVNSPEQTLPEGTTELIREIGWELTSAADYRTAMDAAGTGSVDAVILTEPAGEGAADEKARDYERLLRIIDARRIAAILVSDQPRQARPNPRSLIDTVGREVSPPELRGRLAMIERYHGLMKGMERELANMQRLGKRLNEHFQEMDQEMRLAARLQRDFLPDVKKPIENIQFATVYRPASWVSGDMFDVFRLNENVTGFYVADAVGHGMAASLLTMYVKRALLAGRIGDDGREIPTPSETMAALNEALADQALPNYQFVTACYALIDHRTLTLQFARAGHPYPLLITPEGTVSELKASGGLLGIFKGEEFPTVETRLHPGDKLLLYTDGMELALADGGSDSSVATALGQALKSVAASPIQTIVTHIESLLTGEPDSSLACDDVTLLGLEVLDR